MAIPKISSFPVVVSSLNPKTTEKTLFFHFKEFGRIINEVKIMREENGQSKCFGFVNYGDNNSALNACAKMNKTVIDGFTITVNPKGMTTKDSSIINYKRLTDCIFFQNGNCQKNKDCLYRHKDVRGKDQCLSWLDRKCQNVNCLYAHPPLRKKADLQIENGTKPEIDLTLDMTVHVKIDKTIHHGIVKWIGKVQEFGNEKLVGIHLESPIDQGNDGVIQGKRYFSCPAKCGYFTKASQCTLSKLPSTTKDGVTSVSHYICGYYLKNLCANGEDCAGIHPHVNHSFVWCYRGRGESTAYNYLRTDLSLQVEEYYSDPSNEEFQLSECIIDFGEWTGFYKGKNSEFKRISTKSTVLTDEPCATEWCWYWLDENSKWSLYNTENATSKSIERSYQTYLESPRKFAIKFSTKEFNYELNFKNFCQMNLETSTKRIIRRRPKFVIDKPTLKSPVHTTSGEKHFPSNWPKTSSMDEVQLINVPDDVRSKIERSFAKSMPLNNCTIVSVEEVVNKKLYMQYIMKRKLMKSLGDPKKMNLWHGTSADNVEQIMHQNFDWRICKNGAYGSGSYFAKDASYSNSYSGQDIKGLKHMFFADVLVGDYTMGNSKYKRPPVKSKHVLYDSCVNNEWNPTIFVIFDSSQFYPRYLIKYK